MCNTQLNLLCQCLTLATMLGCNIARRDDSRSLAITIMQGNKDD